MGQFIAITAADGRSCPAYLAEPAGQPRGAVVVLQVLAVQWSVLQGIFDTTALALDERFGLRERVSN